MTPSFLFSLPKAFTSTGNQLNLPIKMFSYGDAYASISHTCINTYIREILDRKKKSRNSLDPENCLQRTVNSLVNTTFNQNALLFIHPPTAVSVYNCYKSLPVLKY